MVSQTPDGLVCDLDGVLYRGDVPIPGAPETVARLRADGVRFLFCSNNSRSTVHGYVTKLSGLGIPAAPEDILTSAVVLGEEVARRGLSGGAAFVVGGPGLRLAVEKAGMDVLEGEEGRRADLVAVGWDRGFTFDKMRIAASAVREGAAFLASNDDASFPASDGLWPGAGAVLASIEVGAGRRAEVVGKPHEPMRRAAAERLEGCDRIAVVGDRIETDIEMGWALGWQTILVLTGVTTEEEVASLERAPDLVLASFSEMMLEVDQ